ncbi:hypothetical protein PN480_03375 [Dolichospermum circinale CS-1225]|uniref:hypothetical protein n=1 Tax=Dolichospermum circinale TaxID=109265 RepID=UPI0004044D8D|nr:hypothetical protein [Dolichospermum circinale]MDB9466563.1 hypothetical protein [Dolichospermum circinale CS-539/09]MDB9471980.1 hypothetical protein [Dolichospermum circinale CS-539]MDB9520995.1 hypothetical protein [Dolichospermum circinale CS-1225]
MQIVVKPEQEKFILEKLQQGKYHSVDELLAVAFQLLEQWEKIILRFYQIYVGLLLMIILFFNIP